MYFNADIAQRAAFKIPKNPALISLQKFTLRRIGKWNGANNKVVVRNALMPGDWFFCVPLVAGAAGADLLRFLQNS
jgi:hypothetical protein